jgi:protoheme IX farnesyltransferase
VNARVRDYYALTKPEVNLLILMTTSAGFVLGNTGPLHAWPLIHTLAGTLLVASGTATLNQYMERSHDALMRRTWNRPLPAERLHPSEALYFGVLCSVAGGLYLSLAVNVVCAMVALSTLVSYLLIYTPLKRKTPLCTLIGAVPGAMPVLIGWFASSSRLSVEAGMLFAVVFLWQFPHFLAIALMYREDYERAGYKMLPAFDVEGRFTYSEIVALTTALAAVTLTIGVVNGRPIMVMIAVAVSGFILLIYTVRLARMRTRVAARQLLHATVFYLPVVLAMLIRYKR